MRALGFLPEALVLAAIAAMAVHGPIAQLPHYHEFADARAWLGIPNAADVLSNVAFAAVGLWGYVAKRGGIAWTAFDASLVLTAIGSACYHLAPDDARLVWDRLPIALACAALLVAVYEETRANCPRWSLAVSLAAAVASVAWWRETGDLRPYLLLQGAPLVLVPSWQWRAGTPRRARLLFGAALAAYALAKACELTDRRIFEVLGIVSGHTLKHLLAALGAFLIVHARERRAKP